MIAIQPVSEDSVLVGFQGDVGPPLTREILAFKDAVEESLASVIRDLMPGYTTLLCVYEPTLIDFRRLSAILRGLATDISQQSHDAPATGSIVEIPVYYDPEVGPDLHRVAQLSDLTVADVIRIHSGTIYQVYAMGFCPGFAFLGSVESAIAVGRRETPRQKVPAGSVAIANRQTAVYPIESPGGWQLIGRSPFRFFSKEALSLLQVGDRVQFKAIERQAFLDEGGVI